ncbi:hypothetical protein AAK913_14910 [Enterococcus faecium]|uniref:hypothetical protein n=1 Tax=Enterococcus TaxID=1350 RepID=UPI001BCBFFA9|nr:hypothetical protein [Enterococcus lactis]MDQ8386210.1 hypothetical protein [Enterococcus faecium]
MIEIKDIRKNPKELIVIQNDYLLFEFTLTGEIHRMVAKGIEFKSILDAKTNQERNGFRISIYDLFYHQLDWYDLVGSWSPSKLYCNDDSLQWKGNYKNIEYCVTFRLHNNIWLWTIQLDANNKLIEVSHLQNLSLGNYNNEEYSFKEFRKNNSNEACIRVNLGSKSKNDKHNIYIEQGIIDDIKVDYCDCNKEEQLSENNGYWRSKKENLLKHNTVDIYEELNVIKWQTEPIQVDNKIELAFYGVCAECLKDELADFSMIDSIKTIYHSLKPIKLKKEIILDF